MEMNSSRIWERIHVGLGGAVIVAVFVELEDVVAESKHFSIPGLASVECFSDIVGLADANGSVDDIIRRRAGGFIRQQPPNNTNMSAYLLFPWQYGPGTTALLIHTCWSTYRASIVIAIYLLINHNLKKRI